LIGWFVRPFVGQSISQVRHSVSYLVSSFVRKQSAINPVSQPVYLSFISSLCQLSSQSISILGSYLVSQ